MSTMTGKRRFVGMAVAGAPPTDKFANFIKKLYLVGNRSSVGSSFSFCQSSRGLLIILHDN